MGIRFDLRVANWLAYVIEPRTVVPQLANAWEEREALGYFLFQLREGFFVIV